MGGFRSIFFFGGGGGGGGKLGLGHSRVYNYAIQIIYIYMHMYVSSPSVRRIVMTHWHIVRLAYSDAPTHPL